MLIRSNYTAHVDRVIDGDTILVTIACPCCGLVSSQRLRLARIDAPEKIKSGMNAWNASREMLRRLVESKNCVIVLCQKWPDKYGRLIGEVFFPGPLGVNAILSDWVNASNEMLRLGFAKSYVSRAALPRSGDAARKPRAKFQ